MKLYHTVDGLLLEKEGALHALGTLTIDAVLTSEAPLELIHQHVLPGPTELPPTLLPPIQSQEVWAAGVTYFRSRTARMDESRDAGGASFYDTVYDADRPELFFKANPHHVVGPEAQVHIRKDSAWNVPEPELTLCISSRGKIIGYTVGNDVSSRDIEGENPLYLPQAKTYDKACALGPCILLQNEPLPLDREIAITIERKGAVVFAERIALDQMKRSPNELVAYLTRENSFPNGAFLLTGTGIIPDNDFTLVFGDSISITIDGIGTLNNTVA